jgi:hypothetical protein
MEMILLKNPMQYKVRLSEGHLKAAFRIALRRFELVRDPRSCCTRGESGEGLPAIVYLSSSANPRLLGITNFDSLASAFE